MLLSGRHYIFLLLLSSQSYALYCNAAYLGKKALTILTVSDSFTSKTETTAQERQNSFTDMMKLALETAVELENK